MWWYFFYIISSFFLPVFKEIFCIALLQLSQRHIFIKFIPFITINWTCKFIVHVIVVIIFWKFIIIFIGRLINSFLVWIVNVIIETGILNWLRLLIISEYIFIWSRLFKICLRFLPYYTLGKHITLFENFVFIY